MSGLVNFSNFKPILAANTRTGVSHRAGVVGQTFNLKYRKFLAKDKNSGKIDTVQTSFTLSNKLFEELNLADKNTGFLAAVFEGKAYLCRVENDNATLLKTTSKNEKGVKGKSFKSSLLEQALLEQGVLVDTIGLTQKLDLTLVEGSETAVIGEGIQTSGIYEITKAADAELTDEEKAADSTENKVEVPAEVVSNGEPENLEAASAPAETSEPIEASAPSTIVDVDDDF